MSLNAATIEILIAKGLTAADLLEVARATEVKADRTNADRQARHRRKRNAVTVTDAPPNESISNPASSEPEGSTEARPARTKLNLELPDWIPAEPWAAFVENRKAMRNVPFKAAAAKGVIAEIDKLRRDGHDPAKLLEKAVIRGWRTVFPDDDTRQSANGVGLKPRTAEDLRNGIKRAENNDDPDRAAELKRQLAALTQKPPDPKVTQIVRQVANGMRA